MDMSQAKSNDKPAAKRPVERKWRRRLAALALGVAVFWGIPEIIVRIADPPLEQYTEIYFMGDQNSPRLFMKDPYLDWKLRANVNLKFLGTDVRTDADGFRGPARARRRCNVLCLGDSTTFGWRVGESEAFPARLEAMLNGRAGASGPWQVLNAGVPAYSSLQVRMLAERLVPVWRPEVVVVCLGNNESSPAKRSDRQHAADRRIAAPVEAFLTHSRFLVWLKERIVPARYETFFAVSPGAARARATPAEFEANLRDILRIARDHGARPILLAPPVCLYVPPRARTKLMPEWTRWGRWGRRVQDLVRAGRLDEAAEEAEKILAENSGHFYAVWLKGMVLAEKGSVAAARRMLEEAFDRHPFPERATRAYRDVVRRVADSEAAEYVDTNEMFRSIMDGPEQRSLYLDWCHPTRLGHDIIARRLAQIIRAPREAGPELQPPT